MSTTKRRRITLFDLMVLTAATAIGLSLVQFGWPRKAAGPWIFTWPVLPSKRSGYTSKTWMLPIAERAVLLLPCLAAWTGAYLVTRLRGDRPRRRRLVLQPGLVAAVAALGVLAMESILLIGSAKIDGRFDWASPERVGEFVANAIVLLAHHAGWAVAVSWLALILIGRWRPEPSWVDRLGACPGLHLDHRRADGEPPDRPCHLVGRFHQLNPPDVRYTSLRPWPRCPNRDFDIEIARLRISIQGCAWSPV